MTKDLRIKVCGMKYPENINQIKSLNINWLGFIFYDQSPRYSSNHITEPFLNQLKIGVFVNETIENIKNIITSHHLNGIQLHGEETPDFCENIKSNDIIVIKAMRISDDFDWSILQDYQPYVDYFLFDTNTKLYGGSGKKFNWDILKNYSLNTPFILSGGIKPEDVELIKTVNHPQFKGIDINSGFEIEPGLKDFKKIEEFIKQL